MCNIATSHFLFMVQKFPSSENFYISQTFPTTVQGRNSGTFPIHRIGGINESTVCVRNTREEVFHPHYLYARNLMCRTLSCTQDRQSASIVINITLRTTGQVKSHAHFMSWALGGGFQGFLELFEHTSKPINVVRHINA